MRLEKENDNVNEVIHVIVITCTLIRLSYFNAVISTAAIVDTELARASHIEVRCVSTFFSSFVGTTISQPGSISPLRILLACPLG